ncbi:MAG: glycosyltransferase family 4 protein [Archangium sp.]|nr:glycosyltransferase family 4 protein [Archangium sp.]
MTRRRVVHVLTVADSLIFVDTLVKVASVRGYEVTVVTSPDARLEAFGKRLDVRTVAIEMPRRVSLLGDWVALNHLRALFERIRPDVVHAGTPKGGLLGMLAAHATRVPVRLFHMRGLASATTHGVLRGVLETTERLSCGAATHVICQSRSLREHVIAGGFVSRQKSDVILEGSNGVDAEGRFVPQRYEAAGRALRARLGIESEELVFGFVGRLVRDKGIPELFRAFERLRASGTRARLLVAGPFEPRDPVPPEVRAGLESHPQVHLLGAVDEPAVVYAASDVVLLPSHREGFPNVPLEAAAMGKPVITTRVPGCIDAVEEGVTGLLVGVDAPEALAAAMGSYVTDPDLRRRHGLAGRERALRTFSRDRIAEAMVELYDRELAGI